MVCRIEIMGLVSIHQKRLIVNLNNKIFQNRKVYILATVSHLVLCKPLTISYKPYWKFLCKLLAVVGWIKYLVPIKFLWLQTWWYVLIKHSIQVTWFQVHTLSLFYKIRTSWVGFLWIYKTQTKGCSLHGTYTIVNLSLEILMISLQTTFYYQTFHMTIWYLFIS